MKIEKQVCILRQAQKLKELGIKQESLFRWSNNSDWEIMQGEHTNTDDCSAFTSSELGKMLYPNSITDKAPILHDNKKWELNEKFTWGTIKVSKDTEAIARASLLIYFIETKNLTVETCNERLLA